MKYPIIVKLLFMSVMIRRIPNIPIFMITPDMIPDTCDGAAGWAYGNHVWKGTKPAFTPNPAKKNKNSNIPVAGENKDENSLIALKSYELVLDATHMNAMYNKRIPIWACIR